MKPKIKSKDPDIRGSLAALRPRGKSGMEAGSGDEHAISCHEKRTDRQSQFCGKMERHTDGTPVPLNKMFIVDAHLDLAYNALRGREVLRPATEQKADEDGIPSVGLPDLRRGSVGLICATIYCEPDEGKGKGYRTAEEANIQAHRQMEWYQKQFAAGEMKLVRQAPSSGSGRESNLDDHADGRCRSAAG